MLREVRSRSGQPAAILLYDDIDNMPGNRKAGSGCR
jgi:hypothetical protein